MKKYWAEFLGTYILVFVGAGAIIINSVTEGTVSHLGIGLSFGLVVMAMIYAIGDISGAHINPAVTIAFWVAKRFPANQVLQYISFQLLGAIFASATLYFLFFSLISNFKLSKTYSEMSLVNSEITFAFLLNSLSSLKIKP